MQLKTVFPWICAAALLTATAAFYSSNQKQSAELTKLRQENQELQKLQASEDLKTASAQKDNEELVQLRKDREDLLRLRGEVRQLREERNQLNQQVQKAHVDVQTAQARVAQAEVLRVNPAAAPQLPAPTQDQAAAQAAFRARYGLQPQGAATPEQAQLSTCINNLRQIEGAKQQWALENNRPVGGLVGPPDIAPYLKSNTVPTCPGGGVYTINPVGINPICSIPSHLLPKQ